MRLTVQLIGGPGDLRALATELSQLSLAMRPRLPFATVDWLVAWWDFFREERRLVRDRFFAHTLRDEHGTLIALAPLMLTERPGIGPVRARCISFWGGDKNVTELRGLVCAPEHEGIAVQALLEYFLSRPREWDWLIWHGVSLHGAAHQLLSKQAGFEWLGDTLNYVVALPDTWEEFRTTRSRNIKESLRKCYNSLKRDNHRFEFHVVSDALELPAAVARFSELHARRAHAKNLTDHADYFQNPAAQSLVLSLGSAADRLPALRVFELYIAGELVASRVAFLLGDELYLYFSGFDPKWAPYSVMTTTVAEAIKWAIEQKVRVLNLSTGTDVSKTRWGPSVVTTCNGMLVSPVPLARLKWQTLQRLSNSLHGGAVPPWLLRLVRRHR